ncbi:hypothetical protein N8T08_000866 [Aspergillus melleus]|uniref:Uncharacterized protein n=1 Tax=Aspergillus melleus TaxID=138277 RepID=A0ACC3BBB7_9EURO|nr:hypothetical protein N8T08_000866 [Aspergillus melleus]
MAARAQKPVGSAAWISTEKENVTQLVDQEMEEVEYPVRHEMDWLNEHMSEIFSNNQFNFTEAFKTPGKLRGKTPRTARKRDANEPRLPLSEVFSSSHKRVENKFNASPAAHRSPTKAIPPPTLALSPTKTKTQNSAENASHPEYPDLSKNLNSFPKYNTDSGYHGMQDDDEEEEEENGDDDDMVLTLVQPDSQASTQPFEKEPTPANTQELRSSPARRTTGGSFHSAQENVRQRGETVEPSPKKNTDEPSPESPAKTQEPEQPTDISSPVQQKTSDPIKEPEPEPAPETTTEPETAHDEEQQKLDDVQDKEELEPEPEPEPELKPEDQAAQTTTKSSPVKAPVEDPVEPPSEPQHKENEEPENQNNDDKDEMALDDNLDDIGSPSDGSTPERPPIRKSSLSFASLPAREPLMKRSLGGTRLSRTSHTDTSKLSGIGSNYLGRQTGGHRMTQAADDNASLNDRMEVDENKETARDDDHDTDTRASELHTKSSTQRLHEKISMLGKLQPSRPTKSIPSAPSLAPTTQVSYPELPSTKLDTRPEENNQKSYEETPAPEPMAVDDDWIKPFSSPYKTNVPRTQAKGVAEKKPSPTVETEHNSQKDNSSISRIDSTNNGEKTRASAKQSSEESREKSSTPVYASPHRSFHKRNGSFSYNDSLRSTTPVGSPSRQQDGPISASKFRLQSIVRSAKGLFSNAGGVSAAAKVEASSPSEPPSVVPQPRERANTVAANEKQQRPTQPTSPRPEGRRTRSSTEQKRKQKEQEDRKREEEEEEERAERARQEKQEKQRAAQLKAAQEKAEKAAQEKAAAAAEQEARAAQNSTSITAPTPQRIPQMQRHTSREPETASQAPKQGPGRPAKPNRDTLQKPKPQPVSIRVGSALSRHIPMASSVTESSLPAPTPASATKQPGLKKKASNQSLHTASSNSSFKSTASTQSQRKAQLASERKKEQEEREARRKEEQRRELERRRAAQQQEEARRQEMRSRADNERRERLAAEDPKKAAQMQAIEKRRLENARRLERQASQQPNDMAPSTASQSTQPARPASRLGSIQPFGRSINPPQPNPAKPPKRGLDEEASHRPAATKTSTIHPSGETKRRRTEDEHNPVMRPTMAPPIRQSNIRKESNIRKDPTKPSIFGHGKPSLSHQTGSSIFKTAQPQRPAHPMDMAKYTTGKIPFAEPSNAQQAQQPAPHKTPGASSSQKAPAKPSPKYPSGENIHLPEIATDSEDEDSEAEMLPVPKWAQPKELESLLRQQEGMEVDSIFGPIAPFSLEDTFKADKKIKKFRERTSSANWAGTDALTQEEIRRDLAERQRLRLNGGWTFGN